MHGLFIEMNLFLDLRLINSVLRDGWDLMNKPRIWTDIILLSDMDREFVLERCLTFLCMTLTNRIFR